MASSPQHSSFHNDGDDTSPFSMLKGNPSDQQGFILRTRSLDEANTCTMEKYNSADGSYHDESAAAALHSSFDATLLTNANETSFFEDEHKHEPTRTTSWDDDDGEVTGRKHYRQQPKNELLNVNAPGTVRKSARRGIQTSRTPMRPRPRPPGSAKKPASSTPSSAVKRRRAPLPQRMSPMRRISTSTPFYPSITSPPSASIKLDHSIFHNVPNGSIFATSPALTPTRQTGPFNGVKSLSKWNNTHATGTTAASTILETTLASTDSVDTSSPTTTRFKFTSFPASLPRVSYPRSARKCPDSVRKHMSFGDTTHSDPNQSRDEEGTQNTSISSLSAEGHHQHLQPVPGALPPTILDLNSPLPEGKEENEDRVIHAQLFADEENFGYSDDDSTQTPLNDTVGRTRLNFNTVWSPGKDATNRKVPSKSRTPIRGHLTSNANIPSIKGDMLMPLDLNMELTKPYDQKRINSFPSSLSSNTQTQNLSGCEEPPASLTPGRSEEKSFLPATPKEVQLHFPLESECSPIPGVRDDHFDQAVSTASDDSDALIGDGLIPRRTSMETLEGSTKRSGKTKEEASVDSNSTSTQGRRLRPMPDMSAFESQAVSSRASDDSTTLDSKSTAQRLMCPPTPVRTPAWANEAASQGVFGRQNSLITTKVLLSAPSQVLEGRSSLENSVLDDDSKDSLGNGPKGLPPKAPLLSTTSTVAVSGAPIPVAQKDGGNTSSNEVPDSAIKPPRLQAPPKVSRKVPVDGTEPIISFAKDFEVMAVLGSGAFADVYKVKAVRDSKLYAVKRNRRQFRGKRDRDMALAEVQAMQRLQSVCAESSGGDSSLVKNSYSLYILFFYRAWQEDGYFFCQTELCCRDTCRELLDNLRFLWSSAKGKYPSLVKNLPLKDGLEPGSMEDAGGRMVPTETIWKICHDVAAGLSHIHLHGLVHHDIKPSNIFLVAHPRFGAMCKIGDFGMTGETGSSADGLEGDTRYMPSELLSSGVRQASSDIFSLGLTLYELANHDLSELPSDGFGWHDIRGSDTPQTINGREIDFVDLIRLMTHPSEAKRPSAGTVLKNRKAIEAGSNCDNFLREYIQDIETFDRLEEERLAMNFHEDQTPRHASHRSMGVRSPSLSMLTGNTPAFFSPMGK